MRNINILFIDDAKTVENENEWLGKRKTFKQVENDFDK